MQSIPIKSSQLKNKNAAALVSFFKSDTAVLYLYGLPGSGKTFAINLLAKEFGYEIFYLHTPFDVDVVISMSSLRLFDSDKKLVVVDVGDNLSSQEVKKLAMGRWGETRLVIIGETYARTNPMRNAFKNKPYKFEDIKFHPFDEMDVLGCLTLYAMELGAKVSYETLSEIAKNSDGDMRAARLCLRTLIASGDENNIECFLPFGESRYFSLINKIFSDNIEDVREAVSYFGNYMTIQIIRRNIIANLSKRAELMRMLQYCSALEVDYTEYLVEIARLVGKMSKVKRFVAYTRPEPFEIPEVQTKCSAVKKVLYFRGFIKWNKKKK